MKRKEEKKKKGLTTKGGDGRRFSDYNTDRVSRLKPQHLRAVITLGDSLSTGTYAKGNTQVHVWKMIKYHFWKVIHFFVSISEEKQEDNATMNNNQKEEDSDSDSLIKFEVTNFRENKDVSFLSGDAPSALSVLSIVKRFNPHVVGGSKHSLLLVSDIIRDYVLRSWLPQTDFNTAFPTATSVDVAKTETPLVVKNVAEWEKEIRLRYGIERKKEKVDLDSDYDNNEEDYDQSVEPVWKFVNIFIGANDLCHMCELNDTDSEDSISQGLIQYESALNSTLGQIQVGLSHTFVNLVVPWVVRKGLLEAVDNDSHCAGKFFQTVMRDGRECLCLRRLDFDWDGVQRKMKEITIRITNWWKDWCVDQPDYDEESGWCRTFGIHLMDFRGQFTDCSTGERYVPLEVLSSTDCFHFSQRGHELFAIDIWNKLFGVLDNDICEPVTPFESPQGDEDASEGPAEVYPMRQKAGLRPYCPGEEEYFRLYQSGDVEEDEVEREEREDVEEDKSIREAAKVKTMKEMGAGEDKEKEEEEKEQTRKGNKMKKNKGDEVVKFLEVE